MATKRRDVLLPLSHEVPMSLTPVDKTDETPKHKPSTKPGTISHFLHRIARFIVAGVLLILIVACGTSYHREIRYLWTTYDFDTTVVYIYSGNDELYPDNLNYFLRHGVKEGDGNRYYIVFQQDEWKETQFRWCQCVLGCPADALRKGPSIANSLPPTSCPCKCPINLLESTAIPSNVAFVYHENQCFDMGTFGELKQAGVFNQINLLNPQPHSRSQYYIILNSSVRGPFLPTYLTSSYRWSEAFTSRINSKVKLVGSTISCGHSPHVQSYLLATDNIGLDVLHSAGVFQCYTTQADTVKYSELGSSQAILRKNYGIDSLMLRYDGVDWRDFAKPGKSTCNAMTNPFPEHHYDGISLNPMEQVFIKVKQRFVKDGWDNVLMALQYDEWTKHKG